MTRRPDAGPPAPLLHASRTSCQPGRSSLPPSERLDFPRAREPDRGFASYAYEWAKGHDLDDVLGDEELTGGDFVRTAKQLIDLLRGIGDVVPNSETGEVARAASNALFRGVIAASSTVGV